MDYEFNRYTTVTYTAEGYDVTERIKWLPEESDADHKARVLDFISEMRRIFGTARFTLGERYEYDEVFVDPTMGE
jgi:hypothetical protein